MSGAPLESRADFELIARFIREGEQVLDLGCGNGALLGHLIATRGAGGYGVEIDPDKVLASIERGISVIQSDLESGLSGFRDAAFDRVILSLTLQAMHRIEPLLAEMLRVGREAIVSFPNFGYWRHRAQIALAGHMPVSPELPYQWYDTPNVHLCTLRDFETFCAHHAYRIIDRHVLTHGHSVRWLPNLLGSIAVYRVQRGTDSR